MKPTARLHDWYRSHQGKIFCGRIFDDVKKRWPNGTLIHTSDVKEIQDHPTYYLVFTQNSIYELPKDYERTKIQL